MCARARSSKVGPIILSRCWPSACQFSGGHHLFLCLFSSPLLHSSPPPLHYFFFVVPPFSFSAPFFLLLLSCLFLLMLTHKTSIREPPSLLLVALFVISSSSSSSSAFKCKTHSLFFLLHFAPPYCLPSQIFFPIVSFFTRLSEPCQNLFYFFRVLASLAKVDLWTPFCFLSTSQY